MEYKEYKKQVNIILKEKCKGNCDSVALAEYKSEIIKFYKDNNKMLKTEYLLRQYKLLENDYMKLSTNESSILCGLVAGGIASIMDINTGFNILSFFIKFSSILLISLLGLLYFRFHYDEQLFFYNNIHKAVLRSNLEDRGLISAL